MLNASQWNCFNLVDTSNIALILFLKCDVTKFRIPPPLSHFVDSLNVWRNLWMLPYAHTLTFTDNWFVIPLLYLFCAIQLSAKSGWNFLLFYFYDSVTLNYHILIWPFCSRALNVVTRPFKWFYERVPQLWSLFSQSQFFHIFVISKLSKQGKCLVCIIFAGNIYNYTVLFLLSM